MTTTVVIKAHVDDKTHRVRVEQQEHAEQPKVTMLKNGETLETVVYDDKQVTVREIPKG